MMKYRNSSNKEPGADLDHERKEAEVQSETAAKQGITNKTTSNQKTAVTTNTKIKPEHSATDHNTVQNPTTQEDTKQAEAKMIRKETIHHDQDMKDIITPNRTTTTHTT